MNSFKRLLSLFNRTACLFLASLLTACAVPPTHPAGAQTVVRVTEEVLLEQPRRLGVNLGKTYYAGDQQFAANPFAHGGFEPGRQTLGFRAKNSTGDTVTDDYAEPGDPHRMYLDSFAGGVYHIATGARAGESGRIVKNEPSTGVFTFEHTGAPLADGDFVWVHGPQVPRAIPDGDQGEQGIGIGDFRVQAEEGVTHDFVPDDERPDNQVLRYTFPPTGARMYCGVKHYIRATPNTTYRVRVKARSTIPGASIGVNMQNFGMKQEELGQTLSFTAPQGDLVTAEWTEYVFEGKTYASASIADNFSHLAVIVAANTSEQEPGHVFFDDLILEDDRSGHPTGFVRDAVEVLKEARCGVLRFYGAAGLGTLTRQFTARNTTEAQWSFLSLESFYRLSTVDTVLDQWMLLCRETGAVPWVTVGSANTPEDWYQLISYLAAPPDFDEDARRRARHGYPEPWSTTFDKIYLEIGNEWWNSMFAPYHLWDPAKYGELCRTILRRIQDHPHFDPEKIEVIAGGWAINAHHWNTLVDANSEGHARISLAPYLMHELDAFTTREDRYLPLFADVDAYRQGPAQSILEGLKQNAKGTRLAVYELNTHTTGGDASAQVVSEIAPSVAAGIAVLNQALSVMETLETDPVVYFTLLQRSYNDRLGLWGNFVREPDAQLRPRPVWHGLRLANQYLIEGNMVRTEVEGSPTWNQPENGSVPRMRNVPYLHAYAFQPEAGRTNLLIINRHLDQPIRVRIELPFSPGGSVRQVLLTSREPTDNNEETERVQLEERALDDFDGEITIPACTATVYKFSTG